MSIPTFEAGNTVQFTFVSSVAPDAAPNFAVTDQDGTLVSSFTALTSGSTAYYALYTMPDSSVRYQVAQWTAQKTVQGSARDFIRRMTFKIEETTVP